MTEEYLKGAYSKVGIDADIVAYSCSFSAEGKPKSKLHSTIDDLMNSIVSNTVVFPSMGGVSGYLTGKGNFRFDVAVTYDYKGNRKTSVKPSWLDESRAYLVDHWNCTVVDGIEADDALATEAVSYYDPDAYVIASLDKDFKTVKGWKYNFKKKIHEYSSEHDALLYFYEQLLTGDSADNIKGLYRVGPKKAQKILEGALTEQEMFARVVKAYNESGTLEGEPLDRILENGRLLHLRRYEGQMWEFPK